MADLLKNIYSPEFYNKFSTIVSEVIPGFDPKKFNKLIFDSSWKSKELKERLKHTTKVLHEFLPQDFEQDAKVIERIISQLRKRGMKEYSLEFMFFPDYVETYGINHFKTAVKSMEFITQFTSCEFAVRPFILKYGDKMMDQMHKWSLHKSEHVRRLASEGSRPRLPWAMGIPELKKNPARVLPILENLKQDSSEMVRRSVANNLNDISKDHPQVVIAIAKKWKGNGQETDALIKHGCRTLLKQGHVEILKYYKLNSSVELKLKGFKIHNNKLKIGDNLQFSFSLHNSKNSSHNIRLEYAIYYLRQRGQYSKKVFKISERELLPNEQLHVQRKQSFRVITTRKFYKGLHHISLIINGKEYTKGRFELLTD